MTSWIMPSKEEIASLLGLLMAVAQWLNMKSSLSLFNWVFIGFVLLAITLVFEALQIQGTIRNYQRDRLIRKLTSFQRSR